MAWAIFGILVEVLLLWLPTTAHAQGCNSGSTSIYGKALLNHRYQEVNALDLGDCIIKCIQDPVSKCQSTNWNMGTSICEFNDAKFEDYPGDLKENLSSIYMTSVGSNTKANAKVQSNAKKSCKEILASGQSKGSGEYLIDPGNTGTPLKVYCDMTTDGGGWILIKNYTLIKPVTAISTVVQSTSYQDISNYNKLAHYLKIKHLHELLTLVGATQLRWYCHKKTPNRVFHVMTKTDAIVRYFTEAVGHARTACGSFTPLPDDTSVLSKNCNSWGRDGKTGQPRVNKWSWYVQDDMRIFRAVVRWEGNYGVGFYKNQYSCDDRPNSPKSSVSSGDKWLVYMR